MTRSLPFVALAALSSVPSPAAPGTGEERATAIAREVERIASASALWPGFDPMAIPLAIFTGERTYLFRHPAPPEGFAPRDATPSCRVWNGRHPAVTSNSSADIGGTPTATLRADARPDAPPIELAATALHEAFHVFQRRRHPSWSGNEGDLLLYPVEDASLLALRRLESEALRRALAASEPGVAACWARRALDHRRERFAGMAPAFATYDRASELNEGLATYVQIRAAGKTTVEIPEREFGAAEIRARFYAVGPALALLLDRFRPGWPEALEANDRPFLDEMLREALPAAEEANAGKCAFTPEETAAIERVARGDAGAVVAKRAARRREFDAREGWRLVVEAADGRPLWPKGFDPLNVERVDGGLLHARFLHLGNDAGEMEAVDGPGADVEAFTEAAGAHPLFQGVRRVAIAGFADKPAVETADGGVSVRAPGLTARFAKASVRESGREVVIRLE